MLKLRILTALVLIPAFVGALWYLPPAWLAVVFGVVIAIGAWEWGGLAKLAVRARLGFTLLVTFAGASVVAASLVGRLEGSGAFALAAAFWLFALIAMVATQGVLHRALYETRAGKLFAGLVILCLVWLAAVQLHALDPQRPALLLYACVLVWTADTFAYFAGHMFGRHKLAPAVSPGKTIEGVIGGVAGVIAMAWLAGSNLWHLQGTQLVVWIALAITTALVSVVGDLVESQYKRVAGVKDSGSILPGHGGILDRIDALTSALPVFALGWLLLFGGRA